jgi:hypothetical protein
LNLYRNFNDIRVRILFWMESQIATIRRKLRTRGLDRPPSWAAIGQSKIASI